MAEREFCCAFTNPSFSRGSVLAGGAPELVPGVPIRAGGRGARACPARLVGTSASGRAGCVDAEQGQLVQGNQPLLFVLLLHTSTNGLSQFLFSGGECSAGDVGPCGGMQSVRGLALSRTKSKSSFFSGSLPEDVKFFFLLFRLFFVRFFVHGLQFSCRVARQDHRHGLHVPKTAAQQ